MIPWLAVAGLSVAAVTAAFGALAQRVLCYRERRRFPPPGVRAGASGLALHFQLSGEDGPTVVLDSALAGTSLSWSEVQPRVAAFARVVSFDRGGFGWSDPSFEPRRVDCLVAELRRGLKALALEPPYVVVGHSYGGFVAKLFWSRHPEDVAGVVLVDVPHVRKWVTPRAPEMRRIERGARIARVASLLAHFGITRLLFRLAGPSRLESLSGLLSKLPASHQAAIRSFWVRPWTLPGSLEPNRGSTSERVHGRKCDRRPGRSAARDLDGVEPVPREDPRSGGRGEAEPALSARHLREERALDSARRAGARRRGHPRGRHRGASDPGERCFFDRARSGRNARSRNHSE